MNKNILRKSIGTMILVCLLFQSTSFAQDDSDDSDLPTAKQVVSDFVEALGGEMSLGSLDAFELKGKLTTSRHSGSFKCLYSKGRLVSELKYDGFATVLQGCDEEFLWHLVRVDGVANPTNRKLKDKAQCRRRFASTSAHQQALALLEFDGEITVEKKTESDDQDVWELKFAPSAKAKGEGERTHFGYFSVESGLLLKMVYKNDQRELTPMIRKFEYGEESMNEVRFWSRRSIIHGDNETVYEYETIDTDPEFSDEDFKVPEEIDGGGE